MFKKIIKDRFDYIETYCKNKVVLNLGSIGSSPNGYSKYSPWLHKNLCEISKECIGLDFDKKNISKAEKLSNSKIYFGNVENFKLNKKFDVVVAGNIIEHISNFSGFFNSIKNHMKKDSILIITTPNAFSLMNIVRIIFTGKPNIDKDHSVFFDKYTLDKMLDLNNFKRINFYNYTQLSKQRVRNTILRVIGFVFPYYNLDMMIVCKFKK